MPEHQIMADTRMHSITCSIFAISKKKQKLQSYDRRKQEQKKKLKENNNHININL